MSTQERFTLGSADGNDKSWLYQLYCSQMRQVIEQAIGWDEQAQSKRFEKSYRIESFDIIYQKGLRVGSLYRSTKTQHLHLSLLLIDKPHQNKGLGSSVIGYLKEQCVAEGKVLTLSVFKNNPATNLYQRLGFKIQNQDEYFYDMHWQNG